MNNKKVEFLDLIILVIRRKKFLILTLIPTMIVTYLLIFFFIEPQYDSKALIIPSEDNSLSGIASLFSDLQGLPLGFSSSSPELSMYTTILYSRTLIDDVIEKYDLVNVYYISKSDEDYMKKTRNIYSNKFSASETENMAYEVKFRSNNPQLSADVVNYVIDKLNKQLIELKVLKSKNNREFLYSRLMEIQEILAEAEDSLMQFQIETGLLSVEDQLSEVMKMYSSLESTLITKEIQKDILSKIYENDSPKLINIRLEVEEYRKRLDELLKKGSSDGVVISLEDLPENILAYYRKFREVEIQTKMLQFMLPLYEQARLEEQKEIPLLQVIDYAIPAEKKDFPPRTILTLLITFSIFLMLVLVLFVTESPGWQNSEKISFIKKNMFKWKI